MHIYIASFQFLVLYTVIFHRHCLHSFLLYGIALGKLFDTGIFKFSKPIVLFKFVYLLSYAIPTTRLFRFNTAPFQPHTQNTTGSCGYCTGGIRFSIRLWVLTLWARFMLYRKAHGVTWMPVMAGPRNSIQYCFHKYLPNRHGRCLVSLECTHICVLYVYVLMP